MKILATISPYLLALVFIVFGFNGFLHLIPQPPPASELAKTVFTVGGEVLDPYGYRRCRAASRRIVHVRP